MNVNLAGSNTKTGFYLRAKRLKQVYDGIMKKNEITQKMNSEIDIQKMLAEITPEENDVLIEKANKFDAFLAKAQRQNNELQLRQKSSQLRYLA